ncbi:hypothetical protein [Actibacterium sp. XHP0104]|uniref:hypothetical protein n=1 Tax=Actibacterium sp. XHP0104 TaxID=2984335 RepID=UPI0021E85408|nr:hypothetical protein [Actibacterium sp. XHP0104]MCV2880593.1 hypothetical protein [Actibacterium sp. XHP0104]
MRYPVAILAVLAAAACEPEIPDSGRGVGFGDYDSYEAQREARLQGDTTLDEVNVLPPETMGTADATPVQEPLPARTAVVDVNNPGISDEQDFSAVSARESIESDAARLEAQREQYVVIEPTALPSRVSTGPNVVEYALSTSNQVGQKVYRRLNLLGGSQLARNCSKYASADLAQQAFLKAGGPERDRLNLDPDGDGFACTWDPTPFRRVAN